MRQRAPGDRFSLAAAHDPPRARRRRNGGQPAASLRLLSVFRQHEEELADVAVDPDRPLSEERRLLDCRCTVRLGAAP